MVGTPRGGRAGPGSQELSHRSSLGHRAPPWGKGWAKARLGQWPIGGPGSVGTMAGQDRAVGNWRPALLGQQLVAPGAEMASWAVGRWREALGGPSRAYCCPQVPRHISVKLE